MSIRPGYFSEVTRDNAYQLSQSSHEPQMRRVYAALVESGELTRWELSHKTGLPLHLICARVKKLMELDVIEETGETKLNPETNTQNSILKIKQLTLLRN